jgi:hypothetical protein
MTAPFSEKVKERHMWKSKHIPKFPPKKCPVFQYHVMWYIRENGIRYVLEKQICLPKWKFKKRYLSGEKLDELIDWTVDSLVHESTHQVVHELEGFQVSELFG